MEKEYCSVILNKICDGKYNIQIHFAIKMFPVKKEIAVQQSHNANKSSPISYVLLYFWVNTIRICNKNRMP